MDTFSTRLRAERLRLDLNQDEMAARCGVARNSQVHYESGKRTPDVGYLLALHRIGVDIVQLLTGAPAAFERRLAQLSRARDVLVGIGLPGEQSAALLEAIYSAMGAEGPALSTEEKELIEVYRQATSHQRSLLNQIAQWIRADRYPPIGRLNETSTPYITQRTPP